MKLIKVTSRTATFEFLNNNPYYLNENVEVFINDVKYSDICVNVFTVFNLIPNTKYKIKVKDKFFNFSTLEESLCINVKDFNAIGDAIHDDTVKIQAAIMCAPDNSCIYFDKGTYLVSSLFLKSNITIYLSKGAKLIAKTDRMDFPIFPGLIGKYNYGVWEGSEVNNFSSIINGVNVDNVCICGEGSIDCRAELSDWYINHRVMNIAYRGHAIFFNRCNNIDVIGISVSNTQSWAIHPYFSNNVSFINCYIKNKPSMPTTDGIDPDCCNNVYIGGCVFDVGDDCIAIKSGTYELAKKYKKSCSNIYITNNLMLQGHGGVVFGSESSGGIEDVVVNKCIFRKTDRGLRIKTRRGRGNIGSINNVVFDNIYMDNVKTPFVINMYYNMGPKGGHEEYVWTTKKIPKNEMTPVLGKFKFTNMKCTDIEYAAGVFLGLPESMIEELSFENIEFNYKDKALEGYPVMIEHNFKMKKSGLYCFNVENIVTNNVVFKGNITDDLIIERSDINV